MNHRFVPPFVLTILVLLTIPSAFGQTVSNIDQMPGWQSCSSCAGGASVPYSTTEFRQSPSLDGASQEFWLGGTTPYSNAIWWQPLTPAPAAHNFQYDFWVYLTNADAPQALEFDVNQSVDNHKLIFGTECDFNDTHQWNIWDNAARHWTPIGLGCVKFTPYTWNHFVLQFQRTSNDQAYFASIAINGQTYYLNRQSAPQTVNAQELNVAVQLDGNWRQDNYSIWVDQIKLTYW